MLRVTTLQNHERMSTQDLLLAIEAAVEKGETNFYIEASGQHDIGGPLWNKDGKKLTFTVNNPGQRVGSMCLPDTEVLVEGSAPADVGWLNAGGIITVKGDAYATGGSKGRDLLIAVVSTIYGIWLIYAAGPKYLFLSMVLYAPGLIFYIWARREQKQKPFNSAEGIIAIIVVVLGLYALYELVSGRLSL